MSREDFETRDVEGAAAFEADRTPSDHDGPPAGTRPGLEALRGFGQHRPFPELDAFLASPLPLPPDPWPCTDPNAAGLCKRPDLHEGPCNLTPPYESYESREDT